LAKKPYFSVGELYSNIFCRIQARMPEDGMERHPAPVHLVLTNDTRYQQSIQLSKLPKRSGEDTDSISISKVSSTATVAEEEVPHALTVVGKAPRLALAIRLRDNFDATELSVDLFAEWLRIMPTIAAEVKVEAGFDSFSTLLIVSIPIGLLGYLPPDPAVISLGPITSSNILDSHCLTATHTERVNETHRASPDPFSMLPASNAGKEKSRELDVPANVDW
jgi:hypothetical protein